MAAGNKNLNNLAAIIAAAGYSSRMKSFKALLPLGESTVVENAVNIFLESGIKDISVVTGHRADDLKPVLEKLGVKFIYNANFAEGMFSSLTAGIKSLASTVEGFFLLPVDNPIVNKETIEKLCHAFFTTDLSIFYPKYKAMRGHPPLISSRYIPEILTWEGTGGMRAILEKYEKDALDIEVEDRGVLLDMDTPEDYQTMLEYYAYLQNTSRMTNTWRVENAKIQ